MMDRDIYSEFYTSLALREGQIRLTTFHPAESWSEPAACHIDVVNLSQKPAFQASWYTSDGQAAKHPVLRDDAGLLVTQRCLDALIGIRQQALHCCGSINSASVKLALKRRLSKCSSCTKYARTPSTSWSRCVTGIPSLPEHRHASHMVVGHGVSGWQN